MEYILEIESQGQIYSYSLIHGNKSWEVKTFSGMHIAIGKEIRINEERKFQLRTEEGFVTFSGDMLSMNPR